MADLSKNTQVVSNISVPEVVSVCALTPSTNTSSTEVISDIDGSTNVESFSDLSLHISSSDGGSSLQELIDSELALRVSGNLHGFQEEEYDEADSSGEERSYSEPSLTRKSCESNGMHDINTQFIMAERKSCFENMTTNGMHFFTMIDQVDDIDPDLVIENTVTDHIDHTLPFNGIIGDINGSNTEVLDELDEVVSSSSSPTPNLIGNSNFTNEGKDGDVDVIENMLTCDFKENFIDGSPTEKCDDLSSNRKFEHFFSPFPEYIDQILQSDGQIEGSELHELEMIQNRESQEEEEEEENDGAGALQADPDTHNAIGPIIDNVYIPEDVDISTINNLDEIFNSRIDIDAKSDTIVDEVVFVDHPNAEEEFNLLVDETNIKFDAHGINDENSFHFEVSDMEPVSKIDVNISHDPDTVDILQNCIDNTLDNSTVQAFVHDTVDQVEVCCTKTTDSPTSSSCSDLENKESVTSSSLEKKVFKKKKSDGGDSTKTKKNKKNKKTDSEKENISVKSSFSKFDQLTKKTVLHVRSVDTSKVQKQFNQTTATSPEQTSNCRSCGKQVFQMEQVKAERAIWHKNCFRCKECNKQLTVDNYSSNEGVLYCKPHFKELFKPKAVPEEEIEPTRYRRPKLIICENQPIELPPEVVRASDKPDLGLEELTALNVKSRYQVFEKTDSESNNLERSPSSISVKRSPSILSKLARFQAKGMDIGVTDDTFNNVPYEESSSSSEEEPENENENENEDNDLVRSNRKQRERPMCFNKMGDIKCRWESGHTSKEERREERKQEIQNIRSRLFMGKQGKMKEMYEQAVQDSERGTQKKDIDIRSEKARSIKERFERGETVPEDDDEEAVTAKQNEQRRSKEEDLSIFEEGISKKSRSLFLELDAKTHHQPLLMSPTKSPNLKDDCRKNREVAITPQVSKDVVKSSDAVEDVKVETSEVFSKFKFFETYKEPEREKKKFRITPPREGQVTESSPDNIIYHDPEVVRSVDKVDDEVIKTKTASKMLSIFRQMEENATKEDLPEGPKPLKCFTPPPDYTRESETSEEESDDEDDEDDEEDEDDDQRDGNPNIIRASDKVEDEFLKQATTAARAKALRAKFERWEEKENKLNTTSSSCNLDIDQTDQASIDSTKSLRAKFESLKNDAEQPKERTRPKVNRFV